MAQLTAQIVSYDEEFKRQNRGCIRACGVPVGIVEGRSRRRARVPTSSSWTSAATPRRRWRHRAAAGQQRRAGIFAVAAAAEPDLILQSMRAGANEFFTWPAAHERRDVPRRGPPHRGAARNGARARKPSATHAGVLRRQGRRRHDDGGGQLRRGARAAEQAVDGHRRPEAGPRRGRAVSRRAAALQPARRDRQPAPARSGVPASELVVKHKSGLEILAGSDQFDRPGAAGRRRASRSCSALLARQYEYILVDGGSQINSCTVGRALHRRHDLPGRQPRRAVDPQRAAAARPRAPARRLRRARRASCSTARRSRIRFRRSRSRARSATRFTTRSRATTRRCRPRSTRACRWR